MNVSEKWKLFSAIAMGPRQEYGTDVAHFSMFLRELVAVAIHEELHNKALLQQEPRLFGGNGRHALNTFMCHETCDPSIIVMLVINSVAKQCHRRVTAVIPVHSAIMQHEYIGAVFTEIPHTFNDMFAFLHFAIDNLLYATHATSKRFMQMFLAYCARIADPDLLDLLFFRRESSVAGSIAWIRDEAAKAGTDVDSIIHDLVVDTVLHTNCVINGAQMTVTLVDEIALSKLDDTQSSPQQAGELVDILMRDYGVESSGYLAVFQIAKSPQAKLHHERVYSYKHTCTPDDIYVPEIVKRAGANQCPRQFSWDMFDGEVVPPCDHILVHETRCSAIRTMLLGGSRFGYDILPNDLFNIVVEMAGAACVCMKTGKYIMLK